MAIVDGHGIFARLVKAELAAFVNVEKKTRLLSRDKVSL